MLEFEFRKEQLILTPQIFMIPIFKDLWNHDRSEKKVNANNWFRYIFHLASLHQSNPIRDISAEAKDEEAKFRVFRKKDFVLPEKAHSLIISAVEEYKILNSTSEERTLVRFDDKVDQLRVVLEDTVPETILTVQGGKYVYKTNSTIISKGLSDLNNVKKSKQSVVAAVKKTSLNSKVKANAVLSPLAKGLLDIPGNEEWIEAVKQLTNESNKGR